MGPTTLLLQLFCAWFQCEFGLLPPFIYTNPDNQRLLPSNPFTAQFRQGKALSLQDGNPLVHTNLGPIRGFKMNVSESRQIFAFTGVPYGESTGGVNRFRDPLPRRPWKGTWDATYPSPFCVQSSPLLGGMIRGQEDCLFLDIYTSKLPSNGSEHPLLPVIMWIPAGSSVFGRSRFHGPKYMLREDVIFIPVNHRVGLFGYLTTGDEQCPGNWGLKDQALAVEWVHDNIREFGGDPNKIIIGGISSGGSTSHLMLFTELRARSYVTGIIAISGTALVNQALDAVGQVREASDFVAESVMCPNSTSTSGGSWRMVECLQKVDPYMLLARFTAASSTRIPPFQFRPVVEPKIPSAFISELPEVQYRKRKVPPIPMIVSRTRDESALIIARLGIPLTLMRSRYYDLVPQALHTYFRNTDRKVGKEEGRRSLETVNMFYFNKTSPPNFLARREFKQFWNFVNDALYFAPMWKSIEYHHKVGPTYAYILSAPVLQSNPVLGAIANINQMKASHAMEFILLFNNSKIANPLKGDIEKVSSHFINIIANFAKYGTPLYRTPDGELLNIWKPVEDMRNPVALNVGLINEIKMIQDPVAVSNRWRIWEHVVF
ncbi:unnamed protein product [Orchesella dallaii]|uniref:Carboxylic ester hydrolase n=1 Tax=Orchesella dallaii TaxID=48710 RepID=A0ABP1RS24_9HEXA